MAKVQVGFVAFRDEKGNFLPKTKPIYREIPDEVLKKAKAEDSICFCGAPIPKEAEDELIRLFAKKFLEHRRAMLDAERKRG